MNNYSTEVKSDLANYVDNIGKISIRIMKAKKNVLNNVEREQMKNFNNLSTYQKNYLSMLFCLWYLV